MRRRATRSKSVAFVAEREGALIVLSPEFRLESTLLNAKLRESVDANCEEGETDHDVQNIINCGPQKILFRRPSEITCHRLVKIDHAKSSVERTNGKFISTT